MANKKLLTFIQRLRTSRAFAANKVVDFVNGNNISKMIADFNRGQLKEGKDAYGIDLGTYGIWRTEQREERGLQTDFIDLKFEGNFHESIYAEGELKGGVKAKAFLNINTISPEDWDAIAEDKRFEDALGLNEKNRDALGMMIAQHLQKELLKYYSV